MAGFTFGSSVAAASTACTEHGYEWKAETEDHFSCSKTPIPLGIDAVPTVRFCNGKLCAVSLQVMAPNAWLAAYAKFTDALTKKYGRPASSWGELRSNCATESAFEACIMTDGVRLMRDWKWKAEAKVSLLLVAGQTEPEMTIVYIHRERQDQALVPDAL